MVQTLGQLPLHLGVMQENGSSNLALLGGLEGLSDAVLKPLRGLIRPLRGLIRLLRAL